MKTSAIHKNRIASSPLLPQKLDLQTSGRDPYPNIDLETNELVSANEAKDGRPWLKCCDECAFLDPLQKEDYLRLCAETNTHFYCIHRKDGDENRVCAGFAAFEKKKPGTEPG